MTATGDEAVRLSQLKQELDELKALISGAQYTLPSATDTTLGGVCCKVNNGEDQSGRLVERWYADNKLRVPIATAANAGVVRPGSGLTIDATGKLDVETSGGSITPYNEYIPDDEREYMLPGSLALITKASSISDMVVSFMLSDKGVYGFNCLMLMKGGISQQSSILSFEGMHFPGTHSNEQRMYIPFGRPSSPSSGYDPGLYLQYTLSSNEYILMTQAGMGNASPAHYLSFCLPFFTIS